MPFENEVHITYTADVIRCDYRAVTFGQLVEGQNHAHTRERLRNAGEPFVCADSRVLKLPRILARRRGAIPFHLPCTSPHQRPGDHP